MPALAQDVEVPTSSGTPASGSAPPPPASVPAPAASPAPDAAAPGATPVVLRVGSYGTAVKDLQRELRRRGIKVTVDGAFGPATKRAVKKMQKRLKLRQTGVADARLLKKLGLQVRVVAAAPARAKVAPGTSQYLDVFPVVGEYTYSADFGAPRHQGRHEGVDIMADRGTSIVAVVNGTIERLARDETGLGGVYVWLQRADGTEYYFAHMNAIAEGLQAGSAVTAGQVIGTVGNSGDARYGATHLHFEIRPGGTPIDPYSHLVAVDPTARR